MKKMIGLILVCVLLAAGIVLSCVRIKNIKVTGNKWYTSDQVENLIFPTALSKDSAYCFVKNLMKKKEPIPFVQDYKIIFTDPVSVEVILYEKSVVGYVTYMSSDMYFDKDGIIVESVSRDKKLPGIPEITGLDFGQIILYKPLPVNDNRIFAGILNLTQALSTYEISADLIRYDNSGNATLVIGKINVLLGSSSEMNGKIAELAGILPEIKDLKGTLDLQDYDPTSENPMYSFQKR